MKDPAFLFYSKDFYEGTRMMLPEERACYIDLLIYQHQHGIIPLDLKRVLMYCSGVDEATLKATLKAKFTQTSEGYTNNRLQNEILVREKYKISQSDNGKIGQFWKKSKSILKSNDFKLLSQTIKDKEFILEFILNNEINISTLEGLLKRCLNNKGNVNVNKDINKEKGEVEILEIDRALSDFKKMRASIDKRLTDRAEAMLKKRLNELSGNDMDLAVKILDQSTFRCWQDVYPLKSDNFKLVENSNIGGSKFAKAL